MNDATTADHGVEPSAWFHTEASGFMGARPRRDKSAERLTQRMKSRMRPGPLLFNSLFGVVRHAVTAGIYLGLAYAAKLAFGVSLVFNVMH